VLRLYGVGPSASDPHNCESENCESQVTCPAGVVQSIDESLIHVSCSQRVGPSRTAGYVLPIPNP
jgi:hypothetical protein